MPRTFQHNHKFTKKVNASLTISVSFEPVPNFSDKFDCVVAFKNEHSKEPLAKKEPHINDDLDEDTSGKNPEINSEISRGWFSSLWGSEKTSLIEPKAPEIPLLLGYIQMIGYVRLNHQIGADSGSESSSAVYWKNHEYSSTYCSVDSDEKVQQILHTELFRDESISDTNESNERKPRVWNIGGISDLHAKSFDSTAHYLLHDLVHSYGTMDMPNKRTSNGSESSNVPQLNSHQQDELSISLQKFIVPFYVTAQHLLFSSDTLLPAQTKTFKFRIDVPPDSLPPSYNTNSTGSVGESGLASIIYSFVVGIQEDVDGEMKHRAVYFPIELSPGHYGPDRNWFQHNYLQKPILDKKWSPESLGSFGVEVEGAMEEKLDNTGNNGTGVDGTRESKKVEGESTESSSNSARSDKSSNSLEEKGAVGKKSDTDHNGSGSNDTKESKEERESSHKSEDKDSGEAKSKFLHELDTLIEGSLEALAAKERRKSSVSYASPGDRGLLSQIPEKPRVSYQVRVNDQSLCLLSISSSTHHIGDDVHFSIKLHPDFRTQSRVVGITTHVEAHEIFHLPETRKLVNVYKVTPTFKANTYADALMFPFASTESKSAAKTGGFVNIPRFLTQQFQASTFMDLRYFMVFRFVLNDFPEMESYMIDEDTKSFTEYVSAYKVENESNEFQFSIPLTVLP